MELTEIQISNEKLRFKRLIEIVDAIAKTEFESEAGKKLHDELIGAVNEIVKPHIIKRANEFNNTICN